MMEYITEVLGVKVVRSKWDGEKHLPYYLLDAYRFEAVKIDGADCLILKPRGEIAAVSTVKKHLKRLQETVRCPVIIEMPVITRQRKKSFIEARISFVVPGKQLYLPFLGVLLAEKCDGEPCLPVLGKLQPSAQMLLFSFLLGKCKPVQMSHMAERFGLSAMTLSRAAVQLEETGLVEKEAFGNQKLLVCSLSPEELFKKAQPYLIMPVKKTIYIDRKDRRREMFSAGLMALSEQSMLNPPTVEILGSVRPEKDFPNSSRRLLDGESQCALQLWRYDPRLISGENRVDVFSLVVSLKGENDERVEQCIEELLEKVW